MTLVRAGTLIINFDHIVAVRDLSSAGGAGVSLHASSGLKLELTNPHEVGCLLAWLEAHSESVLPVDP